MTATSPKKSPQKRTQHKARQYYTTDLSYLQPQPNESEIDKKKRLIAIRQNDCFIQNRTFSNKRKSMESHEIEKNKAQYLYEQNSKLAQEISAMAHSNNLSHQKKDTEPVSEPTSSTTATSANTLHVCNIEKLSHTSTPTATATGIDLDNVGIDTIMPDAKKLSHVPTAEPTAIPSTTVPPEFAVHKPDDKTKTQPLPILAKPQFHASDLDSYSIYYLCYYSLMTPEELDLYKNQRTSPMSIAEQVAVDTLEDMLYGSSIAQKEAKHLFWDIQKNVLKKTQKLAKNAQTTEKTATILDTLMDGIEPAEIVDKND